MHRCAEQLEEQTSRYTDSSLQLSALTGKAQEVMRQQASILDQAQEMLAPLEERLKAAEASVKQLLQEADGQKKQLEKAQEGRREAERAVEV